MERNNPGPCWRAVILVTAWALAELVRVVFLFSAVFVSGDSKLACLFLLVFYVASWILVLGGPGILRRVTGALAGLALGIFAWPVVFKYTAEYSEVPVQPLLWEAWLLTLLQLAGVATAMLWNYRRRPAPESK